MLFAFCPQDFCGTQTFRFQDLRTLFTFGLHLAGHGVGNVSGWANVFHFDTRDLHAPRTCGVINNAQQTTIDVITFGQRLVEIHRSHDGAQVGRRDLHDRDIQVGNFIGSFCRIEHLEEHHGIHADHGIILGDDFLPWNVEYLFHHVDLAADAIDERNDEVEARMRGMGKAAKAFNGIDMALPNDCDPHHQEYHCEYQQYDYKGFHAQLLFDCYTCPKYAGNCQAKSDRVRRL